MVQFLFGLFWCFWFCFHLFSLLYQPTANGKLMLAFIYGLLGRIIIHRSCQHSNLQWHQASTFELFHKLISIYLVHFVYPDKSFLIKLVLILFCSHIWFEFLLSVWASLSSHSCLLTLHVLHSDLFWQTFLKNTETTFYTLSTLVMEQLMIDSNDGDGQQISKSRSPLSFIGVTHTPRPLLSKILDI